MRIIPEPVERPFLPNVPRCQHLKINGTQCGSPALRHNRFCFFHKRFQEEQIKLNSDRKRRSRANFILTILEDANAIQVSLMQIMRLLASGQLDPKTAGLLLYALQTASSNLRHTSFEPDEVTDVVIDRDTMDETCVGCAQWMEADFEDEEEEDGPAAAKPATEAAAKPQAAPLIPAKDQDNDQDKNKNKDKDKALPEAASTVPVPRLTPAPNSTAATTPTGDVNMATVRKRIQNLTLDWIFENENDPNHVALVKDLLRGNPEERRGPATPQRNPQNRQTQ